MMWILAGVITLVVLFVSATVLPLYRNYTIAQKVGLPIIIDPVNPMGVLWLLLGPYLLPLLRLLPASLSLWTDCTEYAGGFNDRGAIHKRLGPVFIHVNPARNELVIADPTTASNVLGRRKDFIKPALFYESLNLFGPNVNTAEGEDWQRQRKLTAPCFNEKVSGSVWNIAHTQAKAMLEHNISSPDGSTNSLQDDVRTIALHILVGIGFGIQQDFLAGSTTIRPGHSMSYAESLRTILRNLITTFIFPQKILLLRFMPKKLRKVGVAVEEFLKYNHDMLDIERKEAAEDQEPPPTRTNLLSALVRASDHETPEHEAPKKASQSLSDQEILGNMFIFGLAGHDTTANTLGFAIGLLALYPEWQDWIREELDHVLGSDGEAEYEKAFPRLKRCQAVVFETLRICPAVPYIPKSTTPEPQTIALPSPGADPTRREYIIPPNTLMYINVPALHNSPKYWGSDTSTFRPSRWIHTDSSPPDSNTSEPVASFDSESFKTFLPGQFIPWAAGPRSCPGMKFAQVEAVSVLATVFRRARVRPTLAPNLRTGPMDLSDGKLAWRLAKAVMDEKRVEVTLTMQRPKDLWLKWRMAE